MDRPSSLALRRAVKAFGAQYLPNATALTVALSGGADSLALAAAAVGQGWAVTALIGVPVFLVLMRRAGYVFGGSR